MTAAAGLETAVAAASGSIAAKPATGKGIAARIGTGTAAIEAPSFRTGLEASIEALMPSGAKPAQVASGPANTGSASPADAVTTSLAAQQAHIAPAPSQLVQQASIVAPAQTVQGNLQMLPLRGAINATTSAEEAGQASQSVASSTAQHTKTAETKSSTQASPKNATSTSSASTDSAQGSAVQIPLMIAVPVAPVALPLNHTLTNNASVSNIKTSPWEGTTLSTRLVSTGLPTGIETHGEPVTNENHLGELQAAVPATSSILPAGAAETGINAAAETGKTVSTNTASTAVMPHNTPDPKQNPLHVYSANSATSGLPQNPSVNSASTESAPGAAAAVGRTALSVRSNSSVTIPSASVAVNAASQAVTAPAGVVPFASDGAAVTAHIARPSVGLEAASSVSHDTFAALDADPGGPVTTWVHAGPRQAEAGYLDPSLGWVSVRATTSPDGLHAAVVPGTADAAQALSTHMAGLNSYLTSNHGTTVTATLANPAGSHDASHTGNANTGQGSGNSHSQQQNAGTQSSPGSWSASAQAVASTTQDSATQSPVHAGRISVVA